MENNENIIELTDETGEKEQFEFLDLIEFDGADYVVLLPCETVDEAGEVVILKLEDTDNPDEESYVSVDDEIILGKVFEMFKENFSDEFNFVD